MASSSPFTQLQQLIARYGAGGGVPTFTATASATATATVTNTLTMTLSPVPVSGGVLHGLVAISAGADFTTTNGTFVSTIDILATDGTATETVASMATNAPGQTGGQAFEAVLAFESNLLTITTITQVKAVVVLGGTTKSGTINAAVVAG